MFKIIFYYIRYIFVRYLLKRKFRSYYLNNTLSLEKVSNLKSFNYFGYYGFKISNLNGDTVFLNGSCSSNILNIVLKRNNVFTIIGTTLTWNWQQGCMLQWLSIQGNHVIYNDYDTTRESLCARIIDLRGNKITTISMPIQVVNKDGTFAITLNYDRLTQLRPEYGYSKMNSEPLLLDSLDGIWLIDLKSGGNRLIISIEQLKNKELLHDVNVNTHKINHILLSPSEDKILFLYRWKNSKGRFHRLYVSNIDGSEIKLINSCMTSHCCWINNTSVLAFCEVPNGYAGYYVFNISTGSYKLLSVNLPRQDGHPVIFGNGKYLLIDTYPDLSRFSKLYLFKLASDELIELASLYQPLRFRSSSRIDLHPKLSFDEKRTYIESGHKNASRQLYEIDLTNILND